MKCGRCVSSVGLGRRSPRGERGLKCAELRRALLAQASLPSRGAWIEMSRSRSMPNASTASLPSRGAWIEMLLLDGPQPRIQSRSPHGGRGLKSPPAGSEPPTSRRSPHGGRGLKFRKAGDNAAAETSLPPRGAWIEMPVRGFRATARSRGRSPRGERGLKSVNMACDYLNAHGRSPRGERGLKLG